jgi:hypothetical protein
MDRMTNSIPHNSCTAVRDVVPNSTLDLPHDHVGSYKIEVFAAVTMKNAGFWDVTPCGSCKNRRFGGTYRHHHQVEEKRESSQRSSVASYC